MSKSAVLNGHRQGRAARDSVVLLLEEDPDLAASIPEPDRTAARRTLRARVAHVEPGEWDGGAEPENCAGFLVLSGLLSRDVSYAGQLSRELVGAGDVLRPWDREEDHLPPYSEPTWTVVEHARLAVLDESVLRLGARWPALTDQLLRRTMQRARWLAVRLAIGSATRVDDRLLLLLWSAAGRWGRVTSAGTFVPLPLTHGDLADLVGARRPSVTTALTQLRERGEVEPQEGGWLLPGDPPSGVSES